MERSRQSRQHGYLNRQEALLKGPVIRTHGLSTAEKGRKGLMGKETPELSDPLLIFLESRYLPKPKCKFQKSHLVLM